MLASVAVLAFITEALRKLRGEGDIGDEQQTGLPYY